MRVLLLGGSGNLGSRCIPALLAHGHIVSVYVRNPSKLESMISELMLDRVSVIAGDATDFASIKKAILSRDIEGIINVAGTQVPKGTEFLLPKIAKAVTAAAVEVGKERGVPLRAWLVSGMNILRYPGAPHSYLVQDYIPWPFYARIAQHEATREVVEYVPLSDLHWSLLCVSMMKPAYTEQARFELLHTPRHHNLLLKAESPPAWENTWWIFVPVIGRFLNFLAIYLVQYQTKYEDVADFLAEDLKSASDEWVGMRVGMKDKEKAKAA